MLMYEVYMKEVSVLAVHINIGICTSIVIYKIYFTLYYMPNFTEIIVSGSSNLLLSSIKHKKW
jgi:hypothetical protein